MSGRSLYGTIRISNDGDDDDDNAIAENSALLASYQIGREAATSKSSLSSFMETFREYWSYVTFDWVSPLLEKGNANGQLNAEDLKELPLPLDCTTMEVYAVFCKCWEEELERVAKARVNANGRNGSKNKRSENHGTETNDKMSAKDEAFFASSFSESNEVGLMDGIYEDDIFDVYNHQPSLIRTLYNAFGSDFVRAGGLKLVHDSFLFVGPHVLNRLIHFLRDRDAPLSYGFGLVLAGWYSFVFFGLRAVPVRSWGKRSRTSHSVFYLASTSYFAQ